MTPEAWTFAGLCVVALPSTIGAVIGIHNKGAISDIHILFNSRFTELLDLTRSKALIEGHASGVKETQSIQADTAKVAAAYEAGVIEGQSKK